MVDPPVGVRPCGCHEGGAGRGSSTSARPPASCQHPSAKQHSSILLHKHQACARVSHASRCCLLPSSHSPLTPAHQVFSPEEISAMILQKMKDVAESYLVSAL